MTFSVAVESLVHPMVEADDLRLQQVFMNMLGNAVKFTPAGGRISMVLIEHPARVEGTSDYEFIFADTGCGMDPAFVEHVFEPFTREHDSRTERVEGTGLGLSIVQSVVSLMGGTIEVESAPGAGSTFTVHVNLRHDEGAADVPAGAGDPNAAPDGSARGDPAARGSFCPGGRPARGPRAARRG